MSEDALRIVGLMSGTSADGIDAICLRIEGDGPSPEVTVEGFRSTPWHVSVRDAILATAAGTAITARLNRLRLELAEGFAASTRALLEEIGIDPAQVDAVACHGQTVWHEPPTGARHGATLQLLDAATLAELTGIPVVHDFRSADVAAGGHGAPLVAWPDRILFTHPTLPRAVVNLGGMANVTLLPPGRAADAPPPFAFDIGPANVLLDLAATWATDGLERCDRNGERAARGRLDVGLLSRLMDHPFFDEDPPRSTGRETFGPVLLEPLIADRGLVPGADGEGWDDLLATLTAFTVRSIERAFRRHLETRGVGEVLIAGGGVHNATLIDGLREALEPLPVRTAREALGMDPDAREAAGFAVLGWAFLRGIPGNVPSSTGADGERILGSWTPAPGRAHPDFTGLR